MEYKGEVIMLDIVANLLKFINELLFLTGSNIFLVGITIAIYRKIRKRAYKIVFHSIKMGLCILTIAAVLNMLFGHNLPFSSKNIYTYIMCMVLIGIHNLTHK